MFTKQSFFSKKQTKLKKIWQFSFGWDCNNFGNEFLSCFKSEWNFKDKKRLDHFFLIEFCIQISEFFKVHDYCSCICCFLFVPCTNVKITYSKNKKKRNPTVLETSFRFIFVFLCFFFFFHVRNFSVTNFVLLFVLLHHVVWNNLN